MHPESVCWIVGQTDFVMRSITLKNIDLSLWDNSRFPYPSISGRTTQCRWQSGRPTPVTAAATDCRLWSSTPTFTTWTASSWRAAPWRWAQWPPRTSPCWLTIAGTDRQTWWTRRTSCTGSRLNYDAVSWKLRHVPARSQRNMFCVSKQTKGLC